MNVLDSELVLGQLCALGYEPTDDIHRADLVLLNTCSVREHAEEKVYSRLGEVGQARRKRPGMIVGVLGCMAERDPETIRERAPHVQVLCGPGNLNELPELIREVRETGELAVAVEHDNSRTLPKHARTLEYDSIESLDLSRSVVPGGNVLQSYVRVQRGCDKFCSYCVVPYTRGPERSRPPANIVAEARKLADLGAREITLLGQTVNSYSCSENGYVVRFSDLLGRVNEVDGIERIRFVTSYPGDFTDDIFHAMRDLPKVCEYLHIPVQSGSNSVLQRMKRDYSVEEYIELIDRGRQLVPGLSLAGDFIVGFSGETDAEHADTLKLVERMHYKSLFMFKYSQRPGTAAERRLPDDVPDEVKARRHAELTDLQKGISLAHHRALIGRPVEVLVEGYSKAAMKAQLAEQGEAPPIKWHRPDQLIGRTRGDEIVVFNGPASLIGRLVNVRGIDATWLTLHAELITDDIGPLVSPTAM